MDGSWKGGEGRMVAHGDQRGGKASGDSDLDCWRTTRVVFTTTSRARSSARTASGRCWRTRRRTPVTSRMLIYGRGAGVLGDGGLAVVAQGE